MSTFLYVEDDPLNQQILELLLIYDLGHEQLILFEDSENFSEKLAGLPAKPVVIFLDIHIKPLDGFAVLDAIRQFPEYHSTPVIAVTASIHGEEVQSIKDAGFDGFIAKPIDPDTFPGQLERILRKEEVWDVP